MGNLKELASMIPGVGKAIKDIDIDDNAFKSIEAIIYSMTPAERSNPEILNGSRRTRIAKGSGTTIQEVNRLLKQFDQTRKMMKMVTSSKMGKMMPKMKKGYKYQIKSKVISNNNLTHHISNLKYQDFDYLVVVYFDIYYNPISILKIPSNKINTEEYIIGASSVHSFSQNIARLKLLQKEQVAIRNFAQSYLNLQKEGIIRSRKVVGDIGEYYACKRLNLKLSSNKNEKGLDAIGQGGLTFEIKTRRVYDSERRTSETRRINNLIGKNADYLIVVTLNHAFECSGMWIMPMKNIINPKSANLKIVNTTKGVKNLVPSQISWLNTGEKFVSFNCMDKQNNSQVEVTNSDIKENSNKMRIILIIIIIFAIICLVV